MKSDTRRALMRLSILLCATPGLGACAPGLSISAIPSACSSLLPQEWRSPVPPAPLPGGETVADWIAFADAQTAQLGKANDRTVAAVGIVERCEARDREAVKRARPKFLGLF